MWWEIDGLCAEDHHRWKNMYRWIRTKYIRLTPCSTYLGESDHSKPRTCVPVVTEGCSDWK